MLKADPEVLTNVSGTYIEQDLINGYAGSIATANEERQALADSGFLTQWDRLERLISAEQRAIARGRFLQHIQYDFQDHGDIRRALQSAVSTAVQVASWGGESTSGATRLMDFYATKAWLSIATERKIVRAIQGGKIDLLSGDQIPAVG